jgi:hypothetical protein
LRDISPAADKGHRNSSKIEIVVTKLSWKNATDKIPTTFVSLAPEKLVIEEHADLLVGVFHIMWSDMPRRRTYQLRLQELVSGSGDYFGTSLKCGSSEEDLLRESN